MIIEYASIIEFLTLAYLARFSLLVILIMALPTLANVAYYLQYRVREVVIDTRPVLLNGLGIVVSPILGAGVLLTNALAAALPDLALVAILLGVLVANTLVIIIVLLYEEASGYMP